MRITAGRKIVYVVDCSFTDANVEKIVRFAKDAEILFIEATFLEADAALAKVRHHLTAGRKDRATGRSKADCDVAPFSSP